MTGRAVQTDLVPKDFAQRAQRPQRIQKNSLRTPRSLREISEIPQFPADSGRIVLWERNREWSRLFLNRIRQAKPFGARVTRPPATGTVALLGTTDASCLADQTIFITSFDEFREVIENHPASFAFVEVTVANFRELPGHIPRFRRAMPRLRLAVVCFELMECPVDEYHALDSLFHEAGATAVLATQRDLLAMIPTVLSHFAGIPPQKTDWRETIERRLPWGNGGEW